MDFQFLKYEVAAGMATITLNRPEVYNALNDGITYELQDAFKAVGKDEQVRVVVLSGAGKATDRPLASETVEEHGIT